MGRVYKGSVAVVRMEEQGDGMCILRFCSDGLAGGTGRWNVYAKVLYCH